MPLDPQLDALLRTKLARADAPQWSIPIADVRRNFCHLWSQAMTGEAASPRQ